MLVQKQFLPTKKDPLALLHYNLHPSSNDLHHTIIFLFPAYKEAILRSLWTCERFYIYSCERDSECFLYIIIRYLLDYKVQFCYKIGAAVYSGDIIDS